MRGASRAERGNAGGRAIRKPAKALARTGISAAEAGCGSAARGKGAHQTAVPRNSPNVPAQEYGFGGRMTAPLLNIELARRIELAETQAAVGGAETMRRLRPERGAAVEPIRRPRRPWGWGSMGQSATRSSSGWRISIAAGLNRCAWRPVRWRMLHCSVISERATIA